MKRRRIPHNSGTWHETRRIILKIIGVYTVGLGLMVWRGWAATPGPHHATFLKLAVALWALTMVLLVVIRRVVVTHFIRPLRRRADYDELTGVYRPEVFWQRAEALTRTLTACGRPWAFVYLDLDDFKQVNDTAGHLTGDAVLRKFGALLKAHGRQEDIIGRLGGEEFGWVLSGCTTEEAVNAANRLLTAFQATHCDGLARTCAFSAGVAGW
jgi:diguanylate cyclase (GGDEF)-like protein